MITFVGSGVPIWAIQGEGLASPYVRDLATTEGIVIGVFPDLEGFWIQETETDDDPATSAGLFVLTDEMEAAVERWATVVRVNRQGPREFGADVARPARTWTTSPSSARGMNCRPPSSWTRPWTRSRRQPTMRPWKGCWSR